MLKAVAWRTAVNLIIVLFLSYVQFGCIISLARHNTNSKHSMLMMQAKHDKHIRSKSHTLLDLRNCERWVQAFRARSAAVQDSVTSIQTHTVVESFLPLGCAFITGVVQPPIRLEQDCGTEILLAIPPVGWAGR